MRHFVLFMCMFVCFPLIPMALVIDSILFFILPGTWADYKPPCFHHLHWIIDQLDEENSK